MRSHRYEVVDALARVCDKKNYVKSADCQWIWVIPFQKTVEMRDFWGGWYTQSLWKAQILIPVIAHLTKLNVLTYCEQKYFSTSVAIGETYLDSLWNRRLNLKNSLLFPRRFPRYRSCLLISTALMMSAYCYSRTQKTKSKPMYSQLTSTPTFVDEWGHFYGSRLHKRTCPHIKNKKFGCCPWC